MKSIIKHPLFLIGLALRILLLFYPSQGALREFFIPFFDKSLTHLGENPWLLSPGVNFPYGAALFLILYAFKGLAYLVFGDLSLGLSFISFVSMKLPLLIVDLLLFSTLLGVEKNQKKKLLLYYWLNPVLIYISYVHGQLDLIATCFLIISLLGLTREQIKFSAIFFALAILCKFHVSVVLPLFLAFIWNTHFAPQAKKQICIFGGIIAVVCSVGFAPLLWGQKLLYSSIGSPEAQRIFSMNIDLGNGITLYFGICIFLLVLGRLFFSSRISKEGLIFGSGVLFGVLLLITNTGPGWYFWVFPFLGLFYARYEFAPKSLFWLSCVFYFVVFIPIDIGQPDLQKVFYGFSYTLLQTSLLAMLIYIYLAIIQRELPFVRRVRPYLIGIAGDSGSGKNTLSSMLAELFGRSNTQVVEGDDYHKWERGNSNWQTYTHLHPHANNLSDLQEHVEDLVQGRSVFYPKYDHDTGKFTELRPIKPARTVLVQGLHTFYMRSLRNIFDLRIYMAPSEELRHFWKIRRDCKERGASLEKVLASFEARKLDSKIHIAPQAELADLVIFSDSLNELTQKAAFGEQEVQLKITYMTWNNEDLLLLTGEFKQVSTLKVSVASEYNSVNRQSITISGTISSEQIASIARKVFPNLRQACRSRIEPQWKADLDGVTQLVILKISDRRA